MDIINLSITNMVVTIKLSQPLNLYPLFNQLAIFQLPENININSLKNKIPYFGIDGIIISKKFGNLSEGIRGPSNIQSFGNIDIQCENKNIHIKVSSRKLNIMGIYSEEMGIKVSNYFISHIVMTQNNWAPILNLSNEVKLETIKWVWDNICKELPFKSLEKIPKNTPPNVDPHMALIISLHVCKLKSKEEFFIKMKNILSNLLPIYDKFPEFESINIKNSMLKCNVGKSLSLIETSKLLCTKQKYAVLFHNWHSKQMQVVLPIRIEDKVEDISFNESSDELSENSSPNSKKIKLPAYRWFIKPSGAITMTAPCSYQQSLIAYKQLLKDIEMD